MLGRFPCRSQSHQGVSRRHAHGRHGRRGASFGAPAAVLRAGIDSWGSIDHAGAVYLVGASPPVYFGRPVMAAPPCPLFVSLTNGPKLSVREEEENSDVLIFSEF